MRRLVRFVVPTVAVCYPWLVLAWLAAYIIFKFDPWMIVLGLVSTFFGCIAGALFAYSYNILRGEK